MIPSAWGYGRYGVTYVLPSRTTEKYSPTKHFVNYSSYLKDLNTFYSKLDAEYEYEPYGNGEREISDYVSDVTKTVKSIKDYYNYNLLTGKHESSGSVQSLKQFYKYALGGNQSENAELEEISKDYIKAAAVGTYGVLGWRTLFLFGENHLLKKTFLSAHTAETYYSAMKVLTQAELQEKRHVLCGETRKAMSLVRS